MIEVSEFDKVEMRVGTVLEVKDNKLHAFFRNSIMMDENEAQIQ